MSRVRSITALFFDESKRPRTHAFVGLLAMTLVLGWRHLAMQSGKLEFSPEKSEKIFEFGIAVISIVVALGVEALVRGFARIVQHKRECSLPHVLLAVNVFLLQIQFWWGTFLWRDYPRWDYFTMVLLLINPAMICVACELLIPEEIALREGKVRSNVLRGPADEESTDLWLVYCAVLPVTAWLGAFCLTNESLMQLFVWPRSLTYEKWCEETKVRIAASLLILTMGVTRPSEFSNRWVDLLLMRVFRFPKEMVTPAWQRRVYVAWHSGLQLVILWLLLSFIEDAPHPFTRIEDPKVTATKLSSDVVTVTRSRPEKLS